MSSIQAQLSKTGHLLQALDGATNWRAMGMYILSFVSFFLVIVLGSLTHSGFGAGLFGLIGFLLLLVGLNATGLILMDQARNLPKRSFMDALLGSVFTIHRLIGAVILEILAFVGVMIVVAMLLVVCKIPGLGPLLYTFVFPISAILVGLSLIALYIGFSLIAPAIWEGHGIIASMARLWTIMRQRLPMIILSLFLLALLTILVSVVTYSVVITGSMSVMSLSIPIIGYQVGGGLMGMMMNLSSMMNGYGFQEGSGYIIAGLLGGMVLYTVAASIPAMVGLSGICQIYLQGAEGLDFSQAEAEINNRMEEAKRKAQEAQAKAQAKAQAAAKRIQAEHEARSSATAPAAPTQPAAPELICPKCNAQIFADDVFCGECGTKLK
jgi:hypothetical protein